MFTKLYVNAKTAAHFFMKDRQGVTAIEYAVIAVAISALLFGIFGTGGAFSTAITGAFTKIANTLK